MEDTLISIFGSALLLSYLLIAATSFFTHDIVPFLSLSSFALAFKDNREGQVTLTDLHGAGEVDQSSQASPGTEE
jgi:hypothetical protein